MPVVDDENGKAVIREGIEVKREKELRAHPPYPHKFYATILYDARHRPVSLSRVEETYALSRGYREREPAVCAALANDRSVYSYFSEDTEYPRNNRSHPEPQTDEASYSSYKVDYAR